MRGRVILVRLAFLASLLVLLAGCGSSKPIPQPDVPSADVDIKMATFIANAEYDAAVKYATNILTSARPQFERKAAAYWMDLSLLCIGVPPDTTEGKTGERGNPFQHQERWVCLPENLRNEMVTRLITKLEQLVTIGNDAVEENRRLYGEKSQLTEKVRNMQQLIKDLEAVN